MDENLLNYDMETEDEEAEENGEDVEMEERSKDSQEDDESAKAGWLVEDDYLSMNEMNISNMSNMDSNQIQEEMKNRKVILQKNRESKENKFKEIENMDGNLKPMVILFNADDVHFMSDFACINFVESDNLQRASSNFPIDLSKQKKKQFGEGDNEDIKKGYDPNAINLKLP